MSTTGEPPAGLPRYRLLTGPDDAQFCRRVSEALQLGYELYGSPSATFNGKEVVVAQALRWASAPAGMFSHIFSGVSDFGRALAFYRAVLPLLGLEERFCDEARPWAAWQTRPGERPLFIIGKPYDGHAHEPGNGQMVAFLGRNRAAVDGAYAAAIAHGGTPEGPPGLRPEYHPGYYGAYFRDTEGNKVCVACHGPS